MKPDRILLAEVRGDDRHSTGGRDFQLGRAAVDHRDDDGIAVAARVRDVVLDIQPGVAGAGLFGQSPDKAAIEVDLGARGRQNPRGQHP
ncbi:MAG: hypothetical protein V4466_16455, partial [Pseudomonadota bacterium]